MSRLPVLVLERGHWLTFTAKRIWRLWPEASRTLAARRPIPVSISGRKGL